MHSRCSSTRTVLPCGGNICCSLRATSATSLCPKWMLPTGSVWARSVQCVMAVWSLTQPCQEQRRICLVTNLVYLSLIKLFHSERTGDDADDYISLLSVSVSPVRSGASVNLACVSNDLKCFLNVYWLFQISSPNNAIFCVSPVTLRRRCLCSRPWLTSHFSNPTVCEKCPRSSRWKPATGHNAGINKVQHFVSLKSNPLYINFDQRLKRIIHTPKVKKIIFYRNILAQCFAIVLSFIWANMMLR